MPFTNLVICIFSQITGVIFHFAPGDQMQMISLMKNVAIAGGFVALAAVGPGTISLDGQRLR